MVLLMVEAMTSIAPHVVGGAGGKIVGASG